MALPWPRSSLYPASLLFSDLLSHPIVRSPQSNQRNLYKAHIVFLSCSRLCHGSLVPSGDRPIFFNAFQTCFDLTCMHHPSVTSHLFSLRSRLQAVSFSGPSWYQALLPPHHYILFPLSRVLFPSPLFTFLTAIHPIHSDVSSLGNLLERLGETPPQSSHGPWWLRSLYILITKRSLLNFRSRNKPCFSRQTRTHPFSKNGKPFQ